MSDIVKKSSRLKGMKLRDEFVCPITFEVMHDPVVASDGHTYEKGAIEKWLRSNMKSPRNGEELANKTLIPNLNLKKLLQDLMHEGGSGLYCLDNVDQSRLFDVYPEKIVVLKCLGPPESEWNGQSFQITPVGCVGGRKVVDPPKDREVVPFRDSTVSRKHFEVMCETSTKKYSLRDLGSAGGTFVRIPYNERRELHPGMMLLIGKHQFTVSSIDHARGNTAGPVSVVGAHSPAGNAHSNSSAHDIHNRSIIDSFVDEAEHLIQHLSESVSAQKNDSAGEKESGRGFSSSSSGNTGSSGMGEGLDERLKLLSNKMNHLRMMSHPNRAGSGPGSAGVGVLPPMEERDASSSDRKHAYSHASSQSPARKRQNMNSSRVEEDHESVSGSLPVGGMGDIGQGLEDMIMVEEGDDDTNLVQALRNDHGNYGEREGEDEDELESGADAKGMGMSQTMNSSGAKRDSMGATSAVECKNEDRDRDSDDDEMSVRGQLVGSTGLSGSGAVRDFNQQRCTITCFAPDGSPLQGHGFTVDSDGATIGRKVGNQIPLYIVQQDPAAVAAAIDRNEDPSLVTATKIVNLDTAVSAEHARIEMDKKTGKFYILDGTAKKPSTNGTWVRLSGPNQESPYAPLLPNTELLIGTVRFIVSESMTILEKAVSSSCSGGSLTSSNSGGNGNVGEDSSHHASGGSALRLVQSSMKPPRPESDNLRGPGKDDK